MSPVNWPAEALKALPGVLGSAFATMFFNEPSKIRRVGMFLAGAVVSWYGAAWMADKTGMDQGFAGFLLGLFGMALIQKIFEAWKTFDLGPILRDWLRRILGLKDAS
jgi:hypothetical protein